VLGRHHGFFQRAGLTVGDAWIVTSALVMAASPARRLGEVKA
jgi:hypothetical protein